MDLTNNPVKKLKRSRSLDSLAGNAEKFVNESVEWEPNVDDSGLQSHDGLVTLEKKVDRLNDMCMEQNRVLSELTERVRESRQCGALDEELLMDALAELLHKLVEQREKAEAGCIEDSGARSLLSAIEARPSLERRICDALNDFLQSEELKTRIVSSTTASMKELIKDLFSMEVSSLYVPIMERAHRQLLKHVTRLVAAAFTDLEESTACNVQVLRQTSQTLRSALEQHQTLLQEACAGADKLLDAVATTTEKVLERELKQWREEFSVAAPPGSECGSGRESSCASPEHSAPAVTTSDNPTLSAVDRMMLTAEINKLVKEGDISGAFTKALLAMDLELVVVACRAAVPAQAARALPPAALLSLLQQLPTDLVVDTQLKCSYIEAALAHLSPAEPVTRAHLSFVVSELNRHVAAFCDKYPHHAMSHRMSLIVVTATNLL